MARRNKPRVDEEFREEFDQGWANGSYAGRRIIIGMIIFIILTSLLGFGYRMLSTNADRIIFKESIAYNEAAATFLADSYQEYNEADSETARSAIREYVIMRYPNLDTSTIENDTLRSFYNLCLMGD